MYLVARSRQVCIYWLWKHFLLLSFYLRDEQMLIDIRKPFRSSTCLARYSWSLSSCAFLASPCLAVPFQLLPAQLSLSPAASCPAEVCEMYECTSLRIATETRPTRNIPEKRTCIYVRWTFLASLPPGACPAEPFSYLYIAELVRTGEE
jgi:hypothetical protein